MTDSERGILYQAVYDAILEMGMDEFKQLSFFGRNGVEK